MDDVLSDEALDDLERKRQAALEAVATGDGPRWPDAGPVLIKNEDGAVAVMTTKGLVMMRQSSADFIASANPEAVGKLLSEVRAWRRLAENLKAQGIHMKNTPGEKT